MNEKTYSIFCDKFPIVQSETPLTLDDLFTAAVSVGAEQDFMAVRADFTGSPKFKPGANEEMIQPNEFPYSGNIVLKPTSPAAAYYMHACAESMKAHAEQKRKEKEINDKYQHDIKVKALEDDIKFAQSFVESLKIGEASKDPNEEHEKRIAFINNFLRQREAEAEALKRLDPHPDWPNGRAPWLPPRR